MRKYMQETEVSPYKIMAVDDDNGILDSCIKEVRL